jgi:molybdopterin molybdotransferase
LISTGDELVTVQEDPKPYQVRRSNVHAARGLLSKYGFSEVSLFHFADNPEALTSGLTTILEYHDIVVLMGGFSNGPYDHVPNVLDELGVTILFDSVNQHPGQPCLFGLSAQDVAVFALPGNPVTCLTAIRRYLLPQLYRSSSCDRLPEKAVLAVDIPEHGDAALHVPVSLRCSDQGELIAQPVSIQGLGDVRGLSSSDGILELLPGQKPFIKGTVGQLYRW